MAEGFDARTIHNPCAIDDPQRIPAQRYFDQSFFDLEAERLWSRTWQMACRLEQIPNVGDWVEYSILGKSLIVICTKSGVKAFHNHCRHRGVPLANDAHGNCGAKGFICPFHGWRWNVDGENTFVYGKHLFDAQLLEQGDLALKPCRVEIWGGCAFVNFDQNARPLLDCLGPVAERLDAHGMSKLRSEWWFATVLPANWKIAMEAFMEGYHVLQTHPQLPQVVPELYSSRYADADSAGPTPQQKISTRDSIAAQIRNLETLNAGMAGLVHAKEVAIAHQLANAPLPDDPEQAIPLWFGMLQAEITKQLRAKGEDVPDLNAVAVSHPVNSVEFLFPNYFLLPFFTGMSSYRIRPLGPESCLFELWSLTNFPEGEAPPPPMTPTILPYDSQDFPLIPRQDYSNIPLQQKGLHSDGFEFMRLAGKVEGLISNYQRIIDGYLRSAPPEKLAKATAALGGNFDGPILDFDF